MHVAGQLDVGFSPSLAHLLLLAEVTVARAPGHSQQTPPRTAPSQQRPWGVEPAMHQPSKNWPLSETPLMLESSPMP